MTLSKKDIFSYDDTEYKTIKVKEWGNKSLIIKSMTAREKISWSKTVTKKNSDELEFMIDIVVLCCVDEEHRQLFDKQDSSALQHKQFAAIQYIFEECIKLSAMQEEAVEEEAKN
jgi:hypothetical protein